MRMYMDNPHAEILAGGTQINQETHMQSYARQIRETSKWMDPEEALIRNAERMLQNRHKNKEDKSRSVRAISPGVRSTLCPALLQKTTSFFAVVTASVGMATSHA